MVNHAYLLIDNKIKKLSKIDTRRTFIEVFIQASNLT